MRVSCRVISIAIAGALLASGSAPRPTRADETADKAGSAGHFEADVAPLLARHCVECHGPAKKKARLDLSRKHAAMAGGKSGKAIVPGKASESPLWKAVESDGMPEDSPPLSAREKQLLRRWIDAGAVWPESVTVAPAKAPERVAGENWLRRLTVPEYVETVRSAVGVDVAEDAARILPRDLRADGFSNTAYNLSVDLAHVEAYARLAQLIAGRMDVVKFASQYSKCRELDDACMPELVSGMGKWLLRGPLDEGEVDAFLRVSKAVKDDGGDFAEGVRYVVEAMLQSPRFIYRIEKQRGDGKRRPADEHELASRLSYTLWGGPPDKELMRAADAGELSDPGRVEQQVQRMLKDPRAVERSAQFMSEWLNLDRLASLRPDRKRFPEWDPQLASDMREETLAFFKDLAWKQNRPLSDLLNARFTYATPRLAEHYGFKRDADAAKGGGSLSSAPKRVGDALEALYTFEEGGGDTVRDLSGAGDAMNLKIEKAKAVKWGKDGLTVSAPTVITTVDPPKRLIDAVKKSKAFTVEAWVAPRDKSQSGPARIVTLSSTPNTRNFTLGQEGDKFEVRFRTKKTDANGQPSVASAGGTAQTRLTHVVYTRDASGKARLYVNGDRKGSRDVGGNLSNWDRGFQLALANESTKDRPWRGTFRRVAIYSRALSAKEVKSLAPQNVPPEDQTLSRYDLSSVPGRGGLLTQGSLLTVGGDEASMVARGLFVLKDLLQGEIENPPPCLDTTPIPPKPGLSRRAVAMQRVENVACSACHAKFEPLAFGLEKFDGLGGYHEKDEHGNTLREDGEILFPDEKEPVAYQSVSEMMEVLAGGERVRQVITRKVAQFALGRPLVEADAPVIDKIHKSAWKDGGTYASLVSAIVMSDLVQTTRTENAK